MTTEQIKQLEEKFGWNGGEIKQKVESFMMIMQCDEEYAIDTLLGDVFMECDIQTMLQYPLRTI